MALYYVALPAKACDSMTLVHYEKQVYCCHWLFSHESKVRNLNYHLNCAFWIIIRKTYCILDCVYAKLHHDASFEMRISNDGPEVFSSYASRKSRSEITVWMPWPLIFYIYILFLIIIIFCFFFGGGAKWPSNHFRLYAARCICTEA